MGVIFTAIYIIQILSQPEFSVYFIYRIYRAVAGVLKGAFFGIIGSTFGAVGAVFTIKPRRALIPRFRGVCILWFRRIGGDNSRVVSLGKIIVVILLRPAASDQRKQTC